MSWFTRALDVITPWRMSGEVQREQERKRREEEERARRANFNNSPSGISVGVARPNQNINVQGTTPKPQQPTNIFETLNKNLVFNKPNVVSVLQNPDSKIVPPPKPGTVIKPTLPKDAINRGLDAGKSWEQISKETKVPVANVRAYSKGTRPNYGMRELEKPKQSFGNKFRDIFDANTETDKYKRAQGNAPSNLNIVARSAGSVYSNVAGGLLGVARGLVELPSAALSTPKLIRLGAAKVTGNKQAEENIDNDKGILSELARKYENFVNPVTRKLIGAEEATDRAAGRLAPWAPGYIKPSAKVLSNLIPVEAALAGLSGLSKAKNTRKLIKEGEAALGTAGTAGSTSRVVKIPVGRGIDIAEEGSGAVNIPIQVKTPQVPQGNIIREIGGDANRVSVPRSQAEVAERQAIDKFTNQNFGRPDDRIEGVTPRTNELFKLNDNDVRTTQEKAIDDYADVLRQIGEGNGVAINPETGVRMSNNYRSGMGSERVTKDQWRDEAERQLAAGKADPEIQRIFDEAADPEVQALLTKGEQPDVEPGRPITVKEVKGIDVLDETVVPQNLPETSGTVRATTSTAPSNAKSEVVAAQPTAILPKEVQNVLDNPKQFNKRQVAAARNQVKLAKQKAKADEQIAEQLTRIEAAKTGTPQADVAGREGFVPTGEFGKSGQRGGGAYEKVSREAEVVAGRKEMTTRSAEDLVDELQGRKSLGEADQSKIEAAKENIVKSDPEYKNNPLWQVLNNRYLSDRRKAAQILALGPRVIRKSATSDTLSSRWFNKVVRVVDTSKISKTDLENVQKANANFTEARDNAARLAEQYKQTRSKADLEAFENAQKIADKADIEAKTFEVTAAKNALKGVKGDDGAKLISDLEKEAELNMMDATTASQLSGPATGMRNLYGTEAAGIENRLGANIRAKVTNALFKENVGGYSRAGARAGRKEGFGRFRGDAKRRVEYSGRNPFKRARGFATTINSMGESSLYSQKQSRLYKYYENQLKDKGVSGEQLKNDTRFLALTDPDTMGEQFMDAAMKSSGLSGIYQKSKQIELSLAQALAGRLDGVMPAGAANAIAKGVTRIALGYPTATGNFIVQSGRRATAGLPSFAEVGWKLAKGDKTGAAIAFERGLKEAGGGAAGIGAGVALANAGLITGFYPDDPDERAEWEREGKNELSININGAWYPIPQGFGMFGLPLIVGSTLAAGGPDAVADVLTDREKIFKLLPADQLYGVMQIAAGGATENQDKSFVASTIRSLIPGGSFLNQTAKGLDETANDTSTKGFWSNVMDQVISGLPGINNLSDIPGKTDDAGNPIKNPNLAQVYSGAQTVEQKAGQDRSAQMAGEVDSKLKGIAQYGVFEDPVLESILSEEDKLLYNRAKQGEQLDESDVKSLQDALVKGVNQEGTDTAYLERGQYDTNLAALQLKRDLMKADPTIKPSSLKDIDIAIKRGEVFRDNEIPYDVITDYKDTSNTEWRNMGDPDHEDYDQEMYEMLWKMDELMTKAKVSENDKGKLDKNKYSAKTSGSGRGGRGRGSRQIDTSFGTLKASSFAPRVQQYSGIDVKSGQIPFIRTVRPNIVHKISSSG